MTGSANTSSDYELLFGPAACARGVAVDFDAARHARHTDAPAPAAVEAAWAAARAAPPSPRLAKALAAASLSVYACGGAATAAGPLLEPCDAVDVAFGPGDAVVHFSGRPPAPLELEAALAALA